MPQDPMPQAKSHVTTLRLLLPLTLITFIISSQSAQAESLLIAQDKRSAMPAIKLKDLKKKRFASSDLKGKVTAIALWATWCKPCQRELNELQKIKKDLSDRFQIWAINTDGPQTAAGVRSTVKRKKWKMPILMDVDGSVTAALNPKGSIPYALFVDAEGKIAYFHAGYSTGDEKTYAKLLKALVNETKVNTQKH